MFIWKPGDGSDMFFDSRHQDTVVFGLIVEKKDGDVEFKVVNDQQAGDVFVNPKTKLPLVDVTNSPGLYESWRW